MQLLEGRKKVCRRQKSGKYGKKAKRAWWRERGLPFSWWLIYGYVRQLELTETSLWHFFFDDLACKRNTETSSIVRSFFFFLVALPRERKESRDSYNAVSDWMEPFNIAVWIFVTVQILRVPRAMWCAASFNINTRVIIVHAILWMFKKEPKILKYHLMLKLNSTK